MQTEGLAVITDNLPEFIEISGGRELLEASLLEFAVHGRLGKFAHGEATEAERSARAKVSISDRTENEPGSPRRDWISAKFGTLGILARGRSKHRPRNDPALYTDGDVPLIQTGDVARSRGKVTTFTALYNQVGVAQSRLWPAGTLCITIAANIGDTGVLQFPACFPDSVVGFVPDAGLVDLRYIEFFLGSIQRKLEREAPSTAQKNINLRVLEEIVVHLPVLEEQRAIAAKIDSLIDLIRGCEQAQEEVRAARASLSRASFAVLGDKSDSFALDYLGDLIRVPADVANLELSILNMALRGQLVPQDPAEGTGRELLDHLTTGVHRQRRGVPVTEEPFEVPGSWTWARLGEVADLQMGKTPRRGDERWWGDGQFPFVSIGDLVDQGVVTHTKESVSLDALKNVYRGQFAKKGALLYSFKLTIGKMSLLDMDAVHNEAIVAIGTADEITRDYLFRVLKAIDPTTRTKSAVKGATLNSKSLALLEIPLPPLAEQIRIAARIDELRAHVVRLREGLAA